MCERENNNFPINEFTRFPDEGKWDVVPRRGLRVTRTLFINGIRDFVVLMILLRRLRKLTPRMKAVETVTYEDTL